MGNFTKTHSSTPIVTMHGVSKTIKRGGQHSRILDNISLSIPRGKFTVITGPSGSGKSTLLRIIGGLNIPSAGHVVYDNVDIYKKSDRTRSRYRNQRIGFVFQDYRLVPHYSALENVMIPLQIAGLATSKQKSRATTLLKAVGIDSSILRKVTQLSGGQQQRVGIARALAMQPDILLADEPTGNLDSKTGSDIMRLFKSIQETKGTTIVMVTHNELLTQVADQHIHLTDGKLA